MKKEHPILFSTSMVRAILDGRKTQTRRVIKPQPFCRGSKIYGPEMYAPIVIDKYGVEQPGPEVYGVYDEDGEWGVKLPHQPGDRLWVKETFVKFDPSHWPPKYGYKADMPTERASWLESEGARKDLGYKWTPSIFMPRVASRLTLNLLDVRVEWLQEISSEDAMDEGVYKKIGEPAISFLPIPAFMNLWDSINAKPKPRYKTIDGKKIITHYESYPWDNDLREIGEYRGKPWYVYGNPLVRVEEFSVCENP